MLVAAAGLIAGSVMAATGAQAAPGMSADPSGLSPSVKAVAVDSLVDSLGITKAEAVRRIEAQPAQLKLADTLTRTFGSSTAGTFIDANGQLVVNVLDSATAGTVRSAGATPKLVTRSTGQLDALQASLARNLPAGTAVGQDVRTNQVVVTMPVAATATQKALLARATSLGGAVRVDTVSNTFERQLIGGDAILGPNFRCSAAAIARSGSTTVMITAGHCTEGFPTFRISSGVTIGPTIISSFPSNDYGVVRVNNPTAVNAQGLVRNGGGTIDITASGNPIVGQSACKSGSTTGTTCGRINSNGNTVNYGGGDIVFGMTFSNICTQPGDSGGSLFAGSTVRGIVSGGTVGGCTSTSISIFNPIQEALNRAGAVVL